MTTPSEHPPEHVLQLSPSSDAAPLEEAFADSFVLFNETTRRYMEAYQQLEEQFEYLNVKLEETNRQLPTGMELAYDGLRLELRGNWSNLASRCSPNMLA